jgi:mono/diheme cytochrome c family protein
MKALFRFFLWLGLLLLIAAALVWALNVRDEIDVNAPVATAAPSDGLIARGAYLARAGNCATCHTARGGTPYAGGRGIDTPFGMVYSSNLTPDEKTGLGTWSSAHFWRAMHNGRSKSGRLLYPAFPYTSYTQVSREDSDAIFAFLKSQPAVAQPNQAHAMRLPYQSQAALAVWRALYFKPGAYKPDSSRDAEWNRGAYLSKGLGHCSACHTARNAFGGSSGVALAGGLIPQQNWYAPSLVSPHEAGVSTWDRQDIVDLLKTGVSRQASVSGPMTEVVLGSTQYLSLQDLGAIASYLKELPDTSRIPLSSGKPDKDAEIAVMSVTPSTQATAVPEAIAARGAKLYEQHCTECHGDSGKGVPKAYPALAGNRAVTMGQTSNLVQMVLNGGYAPATAGNPRPFGMPPFVLVLNDSDVAAVLTHIRTSWGNQASAVSPLEVNRIRANQAP